MLEIHVNEEEVRRLYLEKLEETMRTVDKEFVFWDMKELKRRVCMSETTIKETFFYAPGFPKYKVGRKWLFPVEETRQFLLTWLKEQSIR